MAERLFLRRGDYFRSKRTTTSRYHRYGTMFQIIHSSIRFRLGRKEGTSTVSPSTGISSRFRYITMSSLEMLVPSSLLIRSGSRGSFLGSGMIT